MATTVLQRQVPVPSVPQDRNVSLEPASFLQPTVQLGSSQHWDNRLVHSVKQVYDKTTVITVVNCQLYVEISLLCSY